MLQGVERWLQTLLAVLEGSTLYAAGLTFCGLAVVLLVRVANRDSLQIEPFDVTITRGVLYRFATQVIGRRE